MKAVIFIAGMAIFGGIAGTGYAEYSRVQTINRNTVIHVFNVTEVYKKDTVKALDAVKLGVRQCAAENYSVEFPPIMTSLVADTIAADYQLVKEFGIGAKHQTDRLIDLRNIVSNRYYDAVDSELETLGPEVVSRVLQMMRDFRVKRKAISRCINEKAFFQLKKNGDI